MLRGRRVPLIAGAVGAGWLLATTSGSFFTSDDHVFFAQDRAMPFGWRYLAEPTNDHFSPWPRLFDHLVASTTDQGWWLAMLIGLLLYGTTLALFTALVRRLVGDHWAGRVVVIAFALSPIFVQALQWWSLSVQLQTQLASTFAALLAALQWARTGRRRWIAVAVLAYASALCAFIKALLVLPLLVVVLYLRPDGTDRPGLAWRRDRLLWAGLAAVTAVYALVVTGDRYYRYIEAVPRAGADLWVKYLVAGWGEGVAPLSVGATVPDALGPGNWLVVVVANLAVVAVVAGTVRAEPRTRLVWLGALGVVLAGMVMNGDARLGDVGVERVALEVRYNAEGAVAMLLAAAMALAAAHPGPPRVRWLPVAACAIGAAFAVDAGLRLKEGWIGPRHRAFFDAFAATWRPGLDIVDGPLPNDIVPVVVTGWNLRSQVLPEREPDVEVGTGAGRPATLTNAGRVVPVELERLTRARPGCGPAVLEVGATGPDDAVVLTLARTPPLRPLQGTVVADSGVPGGPVVRGFRAPEVVSTPLQLAAGQRVKRLLVAVGPVRTVAVGAGACLAQASVERFTLP